MSKKFTKAHCFSASEDALNPSTEWEALHLH